MNEGYQNIFWLYETSPPRTLRAQSLVQGVNKNKKYIISATSSIKLNGNIILINHISSSAYVKLINHVLHLFFLQVNKSSYWGHKQS